MHDANTVCCHTKRAACASSTTETTSPPGAGHEARITDPDHAASIAYLRVRDEFACDLRTSSRQSLVRAIVTRITRST
jgi:hypothetical protein